MNIPYILSESRNFGDFKDQIRPHNTKQKGDCFEALTKYFLQLHPTYTTQLQNVWLLNEVPNNVHKILNLPGPDEGIDLIAKTKYGTYWAIQSKYREDETKSLTRKELSTFTDLAFNICNKIELGLVCTNTDRISQKLKMHGEKLSFCTGEVWRSLDEEFFNRLRRLLKGQVVSIKPLTPRPHQSRAIKNAYKHFVVEKNQRGKMIMPCGTGKSLAGYWIAEKLEAKRILVAVPSLALIKQTLEVWAKESVANKRNINWIAVCSDESVAESRDDVAVLTQDLGVRVHTQPDEIARWLGNGKEETTVIFTTYQSGKATAEAARKAGVVFDVGIMDEAHKTVGKMERLFSHLLFEENIKIKQRIFMTATERQYRGQSDEIISMDDPELYGNTFELLTFKEALEVQPPILSDYKIITIFVSQSEIADLIQRNIFVKPDKGKWDEEMEAEMLSSLVALRKAMEKHPIQKAISFHRSISRAKVFKTNQDKYTAAFPDFGKLETFHVSGKTPTSVRSREVDEFAQATRSLITNARCLAEGIDVPNIDCVLFADPRKSVVDIVQAVGRALRPHPEKKYSYVIVPVLLDEETDVLEQLQEEAFGPILMVLRALAADDERIVEYFRSISQGKRLKGGAGPVEIDIPDGVIIDAERFIESVQLRVWTRLAKLSWRLFEEAREFVCSLGLKTNKEWLDYSKGKMPDKGLKPDDIPSNPDKIYKDKGWISLPDWLGYERVSTRDREYLPFEEAREFVHSLGLKSQKEWYLYSQGKMPEKGIMQDDIPTTPWGIYKYKGWVSLGDWLGTRRIALRLRKYRPFVEAREFVHSLGLKNRNEWSLYAKGKMPDKGIKPEDIPANPIRTYKDNGWMSMGDWLGTGRVADQQKKYRLFKKAREFVRSLGLKSETEWRLYIKGKMPDKGLKPEDIPAGPNRTYKDKGWMSMGDWLGTGTIALHLRIYRPFEEAREFVHSLGLKNRNEWRLYIKGKMQGKEKKPDDIPVTPNHVYKDNGWMTMGDWLGTGTVANFLREYRTFEDAREFVRRLGLKNGTDWKLYSQGKMPDKGLKPEDIPANPNRTYKDKGWMTMGDWLGKESSAEKKKK